MATEAVLSQDAQVDKGENSRMTSFVGAIAISDLVKTTLGPKGMDKILQSVGSKDKAITITNDGATILKALPVENPAAKILIDMAKTQDEEVGDGTTTVTVLCGELLRTAEELINRRIHPQTIIQGWRIALAASRRALESLAINRSEDDAEFRQELFEVARTTLCSKLVNVEKDHFARLAVDAVLRLNGSNNIDHIQIIKKPGGNLRDSRLIDGFVIDKTPGIGQPKRVENARILVANTPMDTDKIKIYGSRVRVEGFEKVAEIEQAEKEKMRTKCNNIINHGINVFINRQLIYDFPDSIFCEAGIMAIEHADFDGIERLAAVTGAGITSTFDHPESCQLGHCALVDEVLIGEDTLIRFSGCDSGTACSIILRGASTHLLDEAERSLHDALAILISILSKDLRQIPGGGCGEMAMANAIDRVLPSVSGKASFAVEGFSKALRQLPYILADNAGLDASQLVSDLRQAHGSHNDNNTSCWMGIDTTAGKIADMIALGVRESYVSKMQILLSASEGAEMILRVDETIKCPPRKRDR